MEYTKVTNPAYTADPNAIECVVSFVGLGDLPFNAKGDDTVAHGVTIYKELLAGKWGKIAPYTPTEEATRDKFKEDRAKRVRSIVVEHEGKLYDGDEISQNRMSRAIVGLSHQEDGKTIPWVLSDNTVVDVTKEDLATVLVLAGQKQTEMWIMEV